MDLDLREARHLVVEALPQPDGDALEGRRGEAIDFVQQAMIERVATVLDCV